MPASYLGRYLAGDREAVWNELTALGPAIRQEPLFADATAVARETMTRARANVEMLLERLRTLGYRFVSKTPWEPPGAEMLGRLRGIEDAFGTLPLSLTTWYEIVGAVDFMGSHPRLSTYLFPGEPRHVDIYDRGRIARASIYPGFEIVTGHEDLDVARAPDGDPLVVESCHEGMVWSLDEADIEGLDPRLLYSLNFAPDSIHKSNTSGGDPTAIFFPEPAMDAPLHGDWEDTYFVPYLRTCFAWGGFPGLRHEPEPPREQLDFLTAGMLPI